MRDRIRSTDMDLLVAQTTMGKVRFPDKSDKELVDMVGKAKDKLSTRFVVYDASVDGKLKEEVPKHKMRHVYDCVARMSLKVNTKAGGRYVASANIRMKQVVGRGLKPKECQESAKEQMRLQLGNMIRDAKHPFYNRFLDMCRVDVTKGVGEVGSKEYIKDMELAKELFRKFIGNNLRDIKSQFRKQFFDRVQLTEVRETRTCTKCGKEKFIHDFPTEKEATDHKLNTKVCTACVPVPEPAEQEDLEDELRDPEDEDDEDDGEVN